MVYTKMPNGKINPTVLVVDDTEDIRVLLSVILKRHGLNVALASSGIEMDEVLARKKIDLIILDIMMPGEDGLAFCRRLQLKPSPPIIMLSAKDQDADKISGLDFGAEDYVSKPFSPEELMARVRVVLRRAEVTAAIVSDAAVEHVLGWRLETKFRKLTSPDNQTLSLSAAEYAVFRVFIENRDRPLKREFILISMAGLHGNSTVRALDTIISRLRRRLREIAPTASKHEELIQTVYGIGYMLKPERQ